jgi:hypothetical protein
MVAVVETLPCMSLACTSSVLYSLLHYQCNQEFGDQLHFISEIILCHKLFFGFLMHGVGGIVLLAARMKVARGEGCGESLGS